MNKRGLLSVIILAGLVLIIMMALILYLQRTLPPTITVPQEYRPAQQFLQDCADSTLADGIQFISLRGGYSRIPENVSSVKMLTNNVPYWYEGGRNEAVSTDAAAGQLATYIDIMLPECLSSFNATDTMIGVAPFNSTVIITADGVEASVKTSLWLTHGSSSYKLEELRAHNDAPLGSMLAISGSVVRQVAQDQMLDVSSLSSSGVNVVVSDQGQSHLILLENGTTRFFFAMEYGGSA